VAGEGQGTAQAGSTRLAGRPPADLAACL